MKIGIVGCGYVFDHYMSTMASHPNLSIAGVTDIDLERLAKVSQYYGLKTYKNLQDLLADPSIDIVVNLTSIEAHYDVTKAALEAGKHVYSEKPLVEEMAQAHELFALAKSRNLYLSAAPSNVLGATSQTMWKAVQDGAIGDVRTVYAEFDDNVIYLMQPEGWRSKTGAPWPYLHEYEMGCTWEHIGYHLGWMCAIFGPVRSVTAFSKQTLPDKTDQALSPADTPDFSVACLDFQSGVVGRITCSIGAPYDHRMRIFGNTGMVHADTYRHYECPVYLEPFSKLSLNARKARSVRTNSILQKLFGVGGRRIPLVTSAFQPKISIFNASYWNPRKILQRWKRSELGQQDKCLGIAALVQAIERDETPLLSHDFILHLTELTLAIQAAGPDGASHKLESQFAPISIPEETQKNAPDYNEYTKPPLLDKLMSQLLDRLHKH